MCCDLIFVILVCKHVGEMVQEKGRNPMPYQILMGMGWIGGGIIGGVIGLVLGIIVSDAGGNGDAAGLGAAIGYVLGITCGAGPVYLVAANVTRDPNYRPPQPLPGASPYGPPPGAPVYGAPPGSINPYGISAPQNPFAEQPDYPQHSLPQPAASPSSGGAVAVPGIPSFLPASAFAPANPGPKRVQFYCPGGHLLEEWSTSAGQQRRCPHCGGVALVPHG
jgi:hypothetical protein